MGRNRGVDKSLTDTLPLSEGDWIVVRRSLTVGEERTIARLSAKSYERVDGGGGEGRFRVEYDFLRQGVARAATYIQSWSLLGANGLAIPWLVNLPLEKRMAILEDLDPDTQTEIEEAITKHANAQQEARDAAKKAQAGGTSETPFAATSPSAG
jgi:hypothetical protein